MKRLDISGNWLVDPKKKWAIYFNIKQNSNINREFEFSIDMWGLNLDGNPLKFKSRRKASKNDYHDTWNRLLSSAWTKTSFKKVKIA